MSDFREGDSDHWNLSRLHQVFDSAEISRILQIRPGGLGSRHGYSWIHTETGLYSVKSGYKVWNDLKLQTVNSVPEQTADYSVIYQSLWTLPTSPKLKNFLWKCLVKALPVGEELQRKHITTMATCAVCGDDKEDALHLFFHCAFARILWSMSPFVSLLTDNSSSIQGKIYTCMQLDKEQHVEYKGLWVWILWRIWKVRNALVFQNAEPDGLKAYNMSLADQAEWKQHMELTTSTQAAPHLSPTSNWLPPPINVLKCNTDASWQDSHDRCGIAWILRDNTGRMKFWGSKTLPRLTSPLEAEASALAWAVMCMGNMGYVNVIFESDSSSLITALHNPSSWPRLHTYTTEILFRSIQGNRKYGFQKVDRRHNQAADKLAKFARDLPLYAGTIDVTVPLWLSPFLDQTL